MSIMNPTVRTFSLVLAVVLAIPACQSRIIKPDKAVKVITETPPQTQYEILDDSIQEQPSMITSKGEMMKMYYVRHGKSAVLAELINKSFPKQVTVTTKASFHQYKTGGLDLLILQGNPEAIEDVDNFIALIEADVLQVEINVRVVEVTRTNTDQRGVSIGMKEVNPSNPNTFFNEAGAAFSSHDFLKSLSPGGSQSGPLAFQGTRFLMDTVQQDLQLDMAIELLSRHEEVEVLSSPTVRVLNGHNAHIETGERTPVPTPTFNKAGITSVTTTFQKTGVILDVTPTVVAEDTIRLEIAPSVSSVTGFSDPATSGGFATPFISDRTAQTVVNVRNGEIFLLGGLFLTTEIVAESKLPLLGDIPILGALFSSSNKQNIQSEILFFLQPRILVPRSGARGRLVDPDEELK